MPETQVRIYRPEDLERVICLAIELDAELATRFGREPAPEVSEQYYRAHFLKASTKYQVLVALYQGRLDGYIIGSPVTGMPEADSSDYILPRSTSVTEASFIFVTPSSRKNGIGKVLVQALMRHVKTQFDYRKIETCVADWNIPSLRLFRSLGFQEQPSKDRSFFTQEL